MKYVYILIALALVSHDTKADITAVNITDVNGFTLNSNLNPCDDIEVELEFEDLDETQTTVNVTYKYKDFGGNTFNLKSETFNNLSYSNGKVTKTSKFKPKCGLMENDFVDFFVETDDGITSNDLLLSDHPYDAQVVCFFRTSDMNLPSVINTGQMIDFEFRTKLWQGCVKKNVKIAVFVSESSDPAISKANIPRLGAAQNFFSLGNWEECGIFWENQDNSFTRTIPNLEVGCRVMYFHLVFDHDGIMIEDHEANFPLHEDDHSSHVIPFNYGGGINVLSSQLVSSSPADPITGNVIQAGQGTNTYFISSGVTVKFEAGIEIALFPGFTSDQGSNFHGEIVPCVFKTGLTANDDYEKPMEGSQYSSYVVYPNPFTNDVNIKFDVNGKARIEVYDLNGKMLFYTESDEGLGELALPLDDYAKGMYIIRVFDDNVLIGYEKALKVN